MKKRLFKAIALTTCIASLATITACGNEEKKEDLIVNDSDDNNNTNNENGTGIIEEQFQIYKLAQNSGYTGTYEEWLESIKGDSVELRVNENLLEWKYHQAQEWNQLLNLDDLTKKDEVESDECTAGIILTEITGGYMVAGYVGIDIDVIVPEVYNGKKVLIVGEGAFKKTGIRSIKLPDSVFKICEEAFSNCYRLYDVKLGNVVEICEHAFYGCDAINTFTFPASLKKVANEAFYDCHNIIEVYDLSWFGLGNPDRDEEENFHETGQIGENMSASHDSLDDESIMINTEDGFAFYYNQREETYFLVGYHGDSDFLRLPDKINGEDYEINYRAFLNRIDITKVSISNPNIIFGRYSFYGCENLKYVYDLAGLGIADKASHKGDCTDFGYMAYYTSSYLISDTLAE